MAVMVTGIGFVGAYIVRRLIAAGEDVVVYGLFGGRAGQSEPYPDIENARYMLGDEAWSKVTVVVGDITDTDLLDKTVAELKLCTDRPLVIRPKLSEYDLDCVNSGCGSRHSDLPRTVSTAGCGDQV